MEALDYLFGTGAHAGRDTREQPVVVLLVIKPVVMLTSSKEQVDIAASGRRSVSALAVSAGC